MDCMSADLRSVRIVNIKEDLEEGILLLGDLKTCGANICWELKSVLNCWAPGTNWDLRKPLWIKGFVALLEWVTFVRLSWGDSLWISMLNAEKPPVRDLFSSVTCWFSNSVNHSFPLSPNKTCHILQNHYSVEHPFVKSPNPFNSLYTWEIGGPWLGQSQN